MPPVANDNLSRAFENLVPKEYVDTERYLNIVQWNIEWFGARKSNAKDQRRVQTITSILEAFNADLFVFQEIAGPSKDGRYPGVLDSIADDLTERGAGDYVVYYTEAGGEQRVAMMWDRDYLRAKTEAHDLFPVGQHKTPDGKDAFARRTPLYAHFEADVGGAGRFDFQAVGVHLKAMEDGGAQRRVSAQVLAAWMMNEAVVDADILIMGDWNAPPNADEWGPIRDVEGVHFEDINDETDFSYMWLANRTSKFLSRIDLQAMSLASSTRPPQKVAQVVRWLPIEEALARTGNMTDRQVIDVLGYLKEEISDHLPTITQFYFAPPARLLTGPARPPGRVLGGSKSS
jgi:endonuclease/exonuclease/phosphatase family metal-dependent hydrolase